MADRKAHGEPRPRGPSASPLILVPLGALAMAMANVFPAAWWTLPISMGAWLLALERCPTLSFRLAWLGGFLYVHVSLSWMNYVAWFIALTAGLYFGLFWAFLLWASARIHHRLALPLWLLIPLMTVCYETLLHGFTIWPVNWLFFGHAWWPFNSFVQVAELGGLSLVSAGVSSIAVALHALRTRMAARGISGLREREAWLPALVSALTCLAFVGFGHARLRTLDLQPGLRVALIQGNVPQGLRLDRTEIRAVLDYNVELTRQVGRGSVDLVVWPESSVMTWPEQDEASQGALAACAAELDSWLLMGATGANPNGAPPSNSAFLFSPREGLVGRADKKVLVPFAETLLVIDYIPPLRDAISDFLSRTMHFRPFLTPGKEAVVWDVAGTKIASLICYDDSVPRPSEQLVAAGAEALFTLSNETWFRDGELNQHLALATFRCIETRTPLARATNDGDTCVIDPGGRITAALPRRTPGILREAMQFTQASAVPAWFRGAATWGPTALGLFLLALALRTKAERPAR